MAYEEGINTCMAYDSPTNLKEKWSTSVEGNNEKVLKTYAGKTGKPTDWNLKNFAINCEVLT